jgi:hypothetical protein
MFLGIVSSWLLLPGIVGLVLAGGIAAKAPAAGPLMALALIPIGLGVLVLVRRHKRGRGLGLGFVIGLLLFGLAAGLCVSSFK